MSHNVSWEKYIKKTESNPPRVLLTEAVEHVRNKDEALDLGAGAMNDSKYLLSVGFKHVTAIDSDIAAQEKAKDILGDKFSFFLSSFENFSFPHETYDLINAQYALPYNSPKTFNSLIKNITLSLKPKGVFAGQLFGNKDSWNTENSGKTFHTKEEAEKLFLDFKIIKFIEEENDKPSVLGKPKHQHLFNFIVSKPEK
ncbi:MAG: class I SAM-dependent methyltransferase [Patescibacteria group bacterium]|nr:class I SAM-dependent methyltransferase [bacterium]MDZ4240949.1 class I SAM-dependent methyltransferase [Patescibacteria group bacterium]